MADVLRGALTTAIVHGAIDVTLEDEPIDWTALARELGTLSASGESGGDQIARAALVRLLGPRQIDLAIEHYLRFEQGYELVRSVLWLLRPPHAMNACLRIYREDPDLDRRRSAVELLRVVADARALSWIDELLSDDDDGIQCWGVGVLDQLVWSELVDPDDPAVEALLRRAEGHESEGVRQRAQFVRGVIASRR
jgi:HEAT repeat protein